MITLQHTRTRGLQRTYTIEANTSGSYVIRLGDKVLRSWSDPAGLAGITRPSKHLQEEAVQAAIRAIEQLVGMTEE